MVSCLRTNKCSSSSLSWYQSNSCTMSSISSSSFLTSIQTPASMVTSNPNITHFLNVKLDKKNYLLWCSQFLPLLKLYDLEGVINGISPCPVRLLPSTERMLNPLSIWNTLVGSNLIRCSYAGLSPLWLRLFLLMSSAPLHLVMCGALWSEFLRHPLEIECSNSNTSCTLSKWAPLLCQSTSSLSSPSWTTWRQWLIQLLTRSRLYLAQWSVSWIWLVRHLRQHTSDPVLSEELIDLMLS